MSATLTSTPDTVARQIWALILPEFALYGAFLVLYSFSSLLLYQRQRHFTKRAESFGKYVIDPVEKARMKTMKIWEISGNIMFVIITIHWIIYWIIYTNGAPARIARMLQFSAMVLSQITVIVGDLVIIHRLWKVVNRNKILVAFPLLALTCFVAFVIPFLREVYLTCLLNPDWMTLGSLMNIWLLAAVASTFSVNIYCTAIISWKIWKVSRNAKQYGGGHLMHVVVILLESAGVYSLWMVVVFIFAAMDNPLCVTLYDIGTELYGVTTMFISVRVGLGWTFENNAGETTAYAGDYSSVATNATLTSVSSSPGYEV